MYRHPVFKTEQLLNGFQTIDSALPDELSLHSSGFVTDGDNLYGFRRSVSTTADMGRSPESLYNGTLKINGERSAFQATEGHGIYIANSPRATRVPGIRGEAVYGVRIPLENTAILDVMQDDQAERSERLAAALHRLRGVLPGIPNPGPKNWDRLYGANDLVVFPPMAVARLCIGATVTLENKNVKPRWGLLRNPDKGTIVAKQ